MVVFINTRCQVHIHVEVRRRRSGRHEVEDSFVVDRDGSEPCIGAGC